VSNNKGDAKKEQTGESVAESFDWLYELKQKCGILDVVSQYVQLSKKGSRYFGCCPFHNEKTPSFCVNADEQFYHCFGCGVSGDVVKFVMEMESLSFIDAAKQLAEKVNFTIPELKGGGGDFKEKKDRRDYLLSVMHDAFAYYYKNLKSPDGEAARNYLLSRKIDEKTIERYGLGLSLSSDGLFGYLRRKGVSETDMKELGLIEGQYDAFSNRIIVPIMDAAGKITAFGGRIYRGEENRSKYKNSTNTALFDKSRTVYALNFVKDQKKKGELSEIILVEGYMDVIALGAAKIYNAVAGMGTALTGGQAKEISRVSKNVLVCYDGDEAGRKAAVKNVEILAAEGAEVKIVNLPDGLDPDDYVRQYGAEGFLKLCHAALPLIDFKLLLCEKQFGLDTAGGRAKYASAAARVLSEVKDEAVRAIYAQEAAKKCGISPEFILEQTKQSGEVLQKKTTATEKAAQSSSVEIAERCVLNFLLKGYHFADIEKIRREWFSTPEHAEIFDFILNGKKEGKIVNIGMLFNAIRENEYMERVINFNPKIVEMPLLEKYYFDCALTIANGYLLKVKDTLAKKFEEASDAAQKKDLLAALSEVQKKIAQKSPEEKHFVLPSDLTATDGTTD
jgi:DNA primase